ncbi:MAG: HlyD family efflux transporter periplasmic adaptor subunit [Muribaculaceae bacterium]|nr:HlyD family efflux transporter periplasmic adaptor subunit [Muribaculaceae bacterium]
MDRQIPKEEIKRKQRKTLIKIGIATTAAIIAVSIIIGASRPAVNRDNIKIATVDRGDIEPSVAASGIVVPSIEEMIICPINSQILEVLRQSGDEVEAGDPLLRLDTRNAQDEYQQSLDRLQLEQSQFERLKINNRTYLEDLEMKVKVSAMTLDRLEAELRNEQYLDSLGSGTHDKVNEAEFACETSRLELQQLRMQLNNERLIKAADEREKQIEINIATRNLAEIKRTLDDAAIRSPRKAIITYIVDEVGAQVSQGSKIAVVSDLSHFKINGSIADAYGNYVTAGGKVIVEIGNINLSGTVGSVTPLSKDGAISFTVNLEDSSHNRLRSGLKVDIHVINSIKENVLRLPNAGYYVGPGTYTLFVQTSDDMLESRSVTLGECSHDKVEVIDGLNEGDKVVISDMKQFDSKTVKLK